MRQRALAIGVALLVAAPSALAARTPARILDAARLGGYFGVTGVVTRAVGVPGEYPGQHVSRTWVFISSCATGPCHTIELVRQRTGGNDKVILRQVRPAFYAGVGSFDAPVRCGRHRYRRGELVPFRITVRITAAVVQGPTVSATRFAADYRNVARTGLTPCFSLPSYDSASYVGSPLAIGAIRREASTRSSTAS
jgi:hypothetical protein